MVGHFAVMNNPHRSQILKVAQSQGAVAKFTLESHQMFQ